MSSHMSKSEMTFRITDEYKFFFLFTRCSYTIEYRRKFLSQLNRVRVIFDFTHISHQVMGASNTLSDRRDL